MSRGDLPQTPSSYLGKPLYPCFFEGALRRINSESSFSKLHLQDPRESAKHQKIGSSRAVHNIWQVDAKEQITLSDGQKACYLSIVDEKSGAWLGSSVFPLYPYQSSS